MMHIKGHVITKIIIKETSFTNIVIIKTSLLNKGHCYDSDQTMVIARVVKQSSVPLWLPNKGQCLDDTKERSLP